MTPPTKREVSLKAGVRRWFKSWGTLLTLLVAVIALGLSGYAIYADNAHYQELIKPHAQHDEIRDRLVRLDDKIERAEQSINARQYFGEDVTEPQNNLIKATELRDQAELAWDKGDYTEADRLIKEAYDILQKIIPTLRTKIVGWWQMLCQILTTAATTAITKRIVIIMKGWQLLATVALILVVLLIGLIGGVTGGVSAKKRKR
jgi:hypothetical protein